MPHFVAFGWAEGHAGRAEWVARGNLVGHTTFKFLERV